MLQSFRNDRNNYIAQLRIETSASYPRFVLDRLGSRSPDRSSGRFRGQCPAQRDRKRDAVRGVENDTTFGSLSSLLPASAERPIELYHALVLAAPRPRESQFS